VVLCRFSAVTLNEHISQDTCPNEVIQKLEESSGSLVSGKVSCSPKVLSVEKLWPEEDK